MTDTGLGIAMVASAPFPGRRGSQVLVRDLSLALRDRGHAVHVVAYGVSDGAADSAGIRIHRTPSLLGGLRSFGPHPWRVVLNLALAKQLHRVVRRQRIDLIHAHNYDAAVAAYWVRQLTGVPVVYHAHNVLSDELGRYFRLDPARRLARRVGRLLDRGLPRRADGVVALSEAVADHLRRNGVAPERLHVIPPGAFPKREWRSVPRARTPGAKVVAYAGNLDPYQDLSVLLEAMVEVRRAEPTAVLEVVTHASCRLLERQMERLGLEAQVRLIIAENYAAVGPVLERADVLVCPRTSWSGFPIKLLNYMAAGRPMVVAAGAARALGDGPWTVVPDGDARALAGALVGALRDPAGQSHLGQASRRRLHEMYDWRRLAPRVEQLYDAVLSRRRDAADETGASCEKALQNAAV